MVNNYHFYQKHKERLQKEACERYQNLSEKEKDKKRKMAQERYRHFIKEGKEKRHQYYLECKNKLSDYRRNYYLTHKKYLLGLLKILRQSSLF